MSLEELAKYKADMKKMKMESIQADCDEKICDICFCIQCCCEEDYIQYKLDNLKENERKMEKVLADNESGMSWRAIAKKYNFQIENQFNGSWRYMVKKEIMDYLRRN